MNHGENNITVVDEQGNEQLCEVLFTFDSEEFGKSYVLYYPMGVDENDDEEEQQQESPEEKYKREQEEMKKW